MRRLIISTGILAACTAALLFPAAASAAPGTCSISADSAPSLTINQNIVNETAVTATCDVTWFDKTFVQYESGGVWHNVTVAGNNWESDHPINGGTFASGQHSWCSSGCGGPGTSDQAMVCQYRLRYRFEFWNGTLNNFGLIVSTTSPIRAAGC